MIREGSRTASCRVLTLWRLGRAHTGLEVTCLLAVSRQPFWASRGGAQHATAAVAAAVAAAAAAVQRSAECNVTTPRCRRHMWCGEAKWDNARVTRVRRRRPATLGVGGRRPLELEIRSDCPDEGLALSTSHTNNVTQPPVGVAAECWWYV